MIYVNKVSLLGRLVRKPDLKKSVNNDSYTTFVLLINKPVPDPVEVGVENAVKIPDPIAIECRAWRNVAEHLCVYAEKGTLLFIEGSLDYNSYFDKNGNRKCNNYVVCKKITYLSNPYDAIEEICRKYTYKESVRELKREARKSRKRVRRKKEEEQCEEIPFLIKNEN